MLTTLPDRSNLDGAIGSNQESKKSPPPPPRRRATHGSRINALGKEYMQDVALAAARDGQLGCRGVQDCEDVIQVEHIGLQRLVDLDRRSDWIAVVRGSSHVLIGEVDESAVVQASEKARRI